MRFTFRRAGGPGGMSWAARGRGCGSGQRVHGGHSVNGNGVAGFHVAKLVMGCMADAR